jgi:hypothetical protein
VNLLSLEIQDKPVYQILTNSTVEIDGFEGKMSFDGKSYILSGSANEIRGKSFVLKGE